MCVRVRLDKDRSTNAKRYTGLHASRARDTHGGFAREPAIGGRLNQRRRLAAQDWLALRTLGPRGLASRHLFQALRSDHAHTTSHTSFICIIILYSVPLRIRQWSPSGFVRSFWDTKAIENVERGEGADHRVERRRAQSGAAVQ